MDLRRTTGPAAEPFTLAEAKTHLREDLVDAANDAYITGLITAARTLAEDRLERTLITSTWTLRLDSFPAAVSLLNPRILSVTSVQYVDGSGAAQTVSASDYQVVDNATKPGRIVPAYGKAWPATRCQPNAVTVVYVAGYGPVGTDVPETIRQWIKLVMHDMYRFRGRSADRPALPQNFAEGLLCGEQIVSM